MSLAELWPPISLTLMLATINTLILLVLGTPIAWWLARSHGGGRETVGAIVALPLVLPPTVLGFYLLLVARPQRAGRLDRRVLGRADAGLLVSGLVIGSIFYSLPFMVQPLRNAFAAIGDEPLEAASCLGASNWQRFRARGAAAGAARLYDRRGHDLRPYGGRIRRGADDRRQYSRARPRCLSIAIYDYVERLQWENAHVLALGMVVFAFVVIAIDHDAGSASGCITAGESSRLTLAGCRTPHRLGDRLGGGEIILPRIGLLGPFGGDRPARTGWRP